MAETINIGTTLSFSVGNVGHGITLGVRDNNAQFGWVISPIAASKLAEALTDAVEIHKLKKLRPSPRDSEKR